MKVLAFKMLTRELYYVLLKKEKNNLSIISKECIKIPQSHDTASFTDWAETQFGLIIERYNPDKIVYKLSTGLDRHEQIFHIYFGLGLLNYVAFNKSIEIRHIAPQSIRPTNFNLHKTVKLDDYIKSLFPNQDTPWNTNIREVVACALLEKK